MNPDREQEIRRNPKICIIHMENMSEEEYDLCAELDPYSAIAFAGDKLSPETFEKAALKEPRITVFKHKSGIIDERLANLLFEKEPATVFIEIPEKLNPANFQKGLEIAPKEAIRNHFKNLTEDQKLLLFKKEPVEILIRYPEWMSGEQIEKTLRNPESRKNRYMAIRQRFIAHDLGEKSVTPLAKAITAAYEDGRKINKAVLELAMKTLASMI